MDSALDLLSPYSQSFAFDETEQALQSLFIDVFTELFTDQIGDIHHYGMPHFGSPKVVERFTKQDGLVVLRRPQSSDSIMRTIYANWRSMASRRGLSFLEFVLQMIWSDQWEIKRMYHNIARANLYPTLGTTFETRDSFLTSRVMIILDDDIDVDEILNLAPIISKLVPANIVANVAVGLELENMDDLQIGIAYVPHMIGNFQYFDAVKDLRVNWTDWSVRVSYSINVDTVRYTGSKTDLVSVYTGYADYNLRALALAVMSDAAYNRHDGIWHSILAFHPQAVGYEVNTAASLLSASILPASLDDDAAAAVMLNRVVLSDNGAFLGNQHMPALLRYLGWAYITGVLYYSVPSDEIKRIPFIYTVDSSLSYVGYADAAEQHIAMKLANDPDWLEFTLKELEQIGDDGQRAAFIQHYTVLPVPPEPLPFDDYVTDPSISLTGSIAHYTAYKTNGTDFYDSYADLDLTDAVTRSLSDPDMQLLQAVTDAANELTGVTDWTFDTENQQVKYMELEEEKTVSFDLIAQQIITNLTATDEAAALLAATYAETVANSIFEADAAKQFVTLADLVTLLEANQVLRDRAPDPDPEPIPMKYEFIVNKANNPDFVGVDSTDFVPVSSEALTAMFSAIRSKATDEANTVILQSLNGAVQNAYQKDPTWSATNGLYNATLVNVTFADAVNQIFATMQNNQSPHYPSAQLYLGKIVETIFLPNSSQQLIKLSDLQAQFEATKVLKTDF